jgi:hypothetical protein
MKTPRMLLASLLLTLFSPATARAGDRFACNLHALSGAERSRHRALTERLLGSVAARAELADGYGFRFASPQLGEVAEWVGLESRCCPFFTFELQLARDGGPLWLRIRGADGVKDFIRAEFAL